MVSFGGAAIPKSKKDGGGIDHVETYAPKNTPLSAFFDNPEIRPRLEKAAEETYLMMINNYDEDKLEKGIAGKREVCEKIREERDELISSLRTDELVKPPVPVMSMTATQMSSFFPKFVGSVYAKNKVKCVRKWATTDRLERSNLPTHHVRGGAMTSLTQP